MKEKIKNIFNSIKEHLNKILDIATLKVENKLLKQHLEDEKKKNKPLIDLANKYKSENRILNIQNTKLKKKVEILGVQE